MTLRIKGATTIKGQTIINWSPGVLFAGGELGAWYDPSDFSTMFQDDAGTTPVTATGQSVGRILDKSGRGNHATQSTSGARPTLQQDSGGKYYLSFDGSNDCLNIVGSASAMKFMHGAVSSVCAGAYFGGGANAENVLFGSNRGTTANIGVCVWYNNASPTVNSLSILVTNGTSGQNVITYTQNNTLSPTVANVIFYYADPTNATPASRYSAYVNNGSVISGNSGSSTASSLNSTQDIQIAQWGSSAYLFSNLRLYGLVMVNSTLSNSSRIFLQAWMNSRTGAYAV